MNQVNEWINGLVEVLNTLDGLPGIALVALLCLAGGYALKLSKKFPNDGIPVVLIVLGGALLPLISDFRSSPLPLRIWLVRNVIVGMLIGLGTWLTHKLIIKRIEAKIPWIGDFLGDNGNGNGAEPTEPTRPDVDPDVVVVKKP